jgi:hypothetical protein
MSETNFGAPTPQFGTAEYAAKPGTDVCKSCKQAITGLYYRVNGSLACDRCVNQLKDQLPKDTHSAFVRGLAFGIGGAVIGLILYSAFTIITGIVIGYVSLAVGWIIAKAFKMGSRGIGGRRYQIAAAALTYAAVSLAAVPIYFSAISKEQARKPARTQTAPAPVSPDNGSSPSDADIASGSVPLEKPKVSLGECARASFAHRSRLPISRAGESSGWGHWPRHPVCRHEHRLEADGRSKGRNPRPFRRSSILAAAHTRLVRLPHTTCAHRLPRTHSQLPQLRRGLASRSFSLRTMPFFGSQRRVGSHLHARQIS